MDDEMYLCDTQAAVHTCARGRVAQILKQRNQELAEAPRTRRGKVVGNLDPCTSRERPNLRGASRIFPISRGQGDWQLTGYGCPSAGKGLAERMTQYFTVEFEVAREIVDIEEILDATVAFTEDDHGFELLRDHGLLRIGEYARCRKVEQRWKGA